MSERGAADNTTEADRPAKRYEAVAPSAFGLALAYFGLSASASGGFCDISSSSLSDGAQAAALILAAIIAIVLHRGKACLREKTWGIVSLIAVFVEAAALAFMGFMQHAGLCTALPRFIACTVVAGAVIVACASWLRRAQGAGAVTAAVLVFSAMAASETVLFAVEFADESLRCLVAAPLVLLQIPCMFFANKAGTMHNVPVKVDDFYAFMLSGAANRRFLATCAIGLGATALVTGFLCGLPGDGSVPDTPLFRGVRLALVAATCTGLIAATIRQRSRAMTVGVWIVMELLAAISLVLFTAFPQQPGISALASTALACVITAFVWHLVVAFLTPGKLDALFYTITVWGICIASHGIGRFVVGVLPVRGESHFVGAAVSLLLLISTQLVLVKLIDVARFAALDNARKDSSNAQNGASSDESRIAAEQEKMPSSTLEKLLGIDEESAVTDVSRAAMQHCADLMGQQFLLSGREVEVLALWAAGFTQKRVAEQLHVSPTTAHTHITRIYAKTGLHSRQEILDYMDRYLEA